jgi:hypothetical protein
MEIPAEVAVPVIAAVDVLVRLGDAAADAPGAGVRVPAAVGTTGGGVPDGGSDAVVAVAGGTPVLIDGVAVGGKPMTVDMVSDTASVMGSAARAAGGTNWVLSSSTLRIICIRERTYL